MFTYHPDNRVTAALAAVFDMLWLTLLLCLCSLPVITAGAAVTAFHKAMRQRVLPGLGGVTAAFFRAFAAEWKYATLLWLLLAVAGTVLLLDYFVCWNMESTAVVQAVLRGITVFCTLLWVFVFLYSFPQLAYFEVSFPRLLSNSLLFALRYWQTTLILLLLLAVTVFLLYLWLWFTFVPLCVFVSAWSWLVQRSFGQYIKTDNAAENKKGR